ncbi:hypothetical protein TREMEDRAFT_64576 [Tremella mesenterica DSM 1558]|uniref:uncharacterized protein n=1 Tax=Tremella mesenterica (strain ATCC 24925 / CBS 8224 / DSM 1558 / NBRC 9311 / NRRL Y-6157 / RJB 2259-6 / UBC 559-6) TaxID=578456 RepID=UPI0003F49CA6|nr:uncharacterized protein TREMEDRAFT_64576 [Tremella mesenterica DSM 1558]EIW67323.1 hypothetical protein TREMEDRAFT_64576 [Tremella mesenterica DSM 1558]
MYPPTPSELEPEEIAHIISELQAGCEGLRRIWLLRLLGIPPDSLTPDSTNKKKQDSELGISPDISNTPRRFPSSSQEHTLKPTMTPEQPLNKSSENLVDVKPKMEERPCARERLMG